MPRHADVIDVDGICRIGGNLQEGLQHACLQLLLPALPQMIVWPSTSFSSTASTDLAEALESLARTLAGRAPRTAAVAWNRSLPMVRPAVDDGQLHRSRIGRRAEPYAVHIHQQVLLAAFDQSHRHALMHLDHQDGRRVRLGGHRFDLDERLQQRVDVLIAHLRQRRTQERLECRLTWAGLSSFVPLTVTVWTASTGE